MAQQQKPGKPKRPRMTDKDVRDRILFWIVLFVCAGGLWYFISNSPKERPYDCDGSSGGSLITFGACRER